MSNARVVDKSGWNYTIIDNQIVETEDLDIYQKMLYISLKRFSNIQTGQAFPGVKKLAVMSGMSERKARHVIADLAEKNYIKVDHRKNQTSLYTILPPPASHAVGGAHGAGGVVQDMQEPPARGADELKKEELKRIEQQKDNYKDNVADAPALPYKTVIDYLNEKAGTSFKCTTKKTQALIHARYKETFTTMDFKKVIDNKVTEWLNDSEMNQYLRPETLFGTKFESYLNQKPKGANAHAGHQSSSKKSNDTSGLHW